MLLVCSIGCVENPAHSKGFSHPGSRPDHDLGISSFLLRTQAAELKVPSICVWHAFCINVHLLGYMRNILNVYAILTFAIVAHSIRLNYSASLCVFDFLNYVTPALLSAVFIYILKITVRVTLTFIFILCKLSAS